MPEAPEVEAVARTLRPLVLGKSIRRLHVRHAIAVRPQFPNTLKKKVEDTRITGVERRGKYLLLILDRGCLAMHFKFDGQVMWFNEPKDALSSDVHVDIAFETNDGALGFVDPRHLGRVRWLARPENSAGIRSLGVDCFSREFTAGRLSEICIKRPRPLKPLLMDQSRIAGLGNIYVTESLWHARLNPWLQSNRLTAQETRRLHKAVVSVLARALECLLDPPPDFHNPEWWFADLKKVLRVYGREGRSCPRCGTKIKRMEQGGRSTYFCPHCQKLQNK